MNNMRKLWAILLLLAVTFLFELTNAKVEAGGTVSSDCTFEGRKLYGKVQVVNSFPDLKVQVVSSFPDLKVQEVTAFPDSCGKWQRVESFPDLKIQFVNSFPDIKIEYVNSYPGLP